MVIHNIPINSVSVLTWKSFTSNQHKSNMSNSRAVFQNLDILAECVEKAGQLDRRFCATMERERHGANMNKDNRHCPIESLNTVKALSAECQELLNDSHKLYHSLNLDTFGTWNSDMMQDTDRVLQYMECSVENYMKSHRMMAVVSLTSENSSLQSASQLLSGEACSANPSIPVKPFVKSTSGFMMDEEPSQDNYIGESNTHVLPHDDMDAVLALPKSPVLPPILKHYRSKSDSFCSPQDPLKAQFMECDNGKNMTSSHPLCNAMNLESPQLRTFNKPRFPSEVDTPSYAGYYFNKNLLGKRDCVNKGQPNSFFAPIQSPQLKVDIPNSPELTLHCRRSVLAQPPAHAYDDEDDTVYRLFSHERHQTKQPLRSPQSPNLAFHKIIPPTGLKKDDHYILPSPEMPADVLSDSSAIVAAKCQEYEICQSSYDTLPSYVKRLISLPKCNECLKNILNSIISWPGNEHKKVTTEATIAEVTSLGGKTKSYIFVLKTLGIMKEISGTSYYELLV